MYFQFNRTHLYMVYSTQQGTSTQSILIQLIFTSLNGCLGCWSSWIPLIRISLPLSHPSRASADSSMDDIKYGRATRGWWFWVQWEWILASEENNCVNVNPKDFLPKVSKILLFKHETEGRSIVSANSRLVRVSWQERALQWLCICS